MATTTPAFDLDQGVSALAEERLAPAEPNQLLVIWRRFRKHKLAVAGLAALTLLTVLCVFAPLVTPYQPETLDLTNTFASSSLRHFFGTDELGRDIFTRLLYAGRISLTIGVATTLVVVVVGSLVGVITGYFGGLVDMVLMRLVDLLLTLPGLPILLVISRMLGQGDTNTILVIIGVLAIFGWLTISRLVRGMVLTLRDREFVEATRALGAGSGRIILHHLLPNSLAPIIVAATLAVGGFILDESALSFLGLGIRPPTPSWGNMLSDVNEYFLQHPLLAFYPGLAILLTVVSINFMGDALRDAFDPRLKQ